MASVISEERGTAGLSGKELCARCSSPMTEMHCKVICVNCGYMRDCNDQW